MRQSLSRGDDWWSDAALVSLLTSLLTQARQLLCVSHQPGSGCGLVSPGSWSPAQLQTGLSVQSSGQASGETRQVWFGGSFK